MKAKRIHKVRAQATYEGDGFLVHRPFPVPGLSYFDPFLLLDEMGPSEHTPGSAKGAPDHPHRGFETVTYLLSGEFEHRDSQGGHGFIRAGDVQWMTAGSGVVHSEMPSRAFQASGGKLHGFQLWVNLPREKKMKTPQYQELKSARIPEVALKNGGKVRVLSGEFQGVRGLATTEIPIHYFHVVMNKEDAMLFALRWA